VPVAPDTSPEVVSPELVLIDPELAQRRRAIELTGAWTPAIHAASIRSRSVPVVEAGFEPIAPRRLRRRPTFVAAAALVLVSATAVLVLRGESATKRTPVATAVTPPTSTALTEQLAPPAPKRAATPAPKKAAVARPLTPRSIQLSWQPVKFATFYHVVLVRSGRQLDIWTRRSTLSVRSLRSGRGLRAGRYRWSIRPGYGNFRLRKVAGRTFYGPVVSRGVFVVPRRVS
jgi:hypothetical protein